MVKLYGDLLTAMEKLATQTLPDAAAKFCELQAKVVATPALNAKGEASSAERLGLLVLFDLKYLLYHRFAYVERVSETAVLAALPEPAAPRFEYRRMQRTFLFRIGRFREALTATRALLAEVKGRLGEEEEPVLEEMRELTYCLFGQKEYAEARTHEQRRLRLLQRRHQPDDFAIVESLLLLAVAASAEFDFARKSRRNALILFAEAERTPKEQLVFTNLMLLLAIALLDLELLNDHLKKLDSLLAANDLFIHFERGALWRRYQFSETIILARDGRF